MPVISTAVPTSDDQYSQDRAFVLCADWMDLYISGSSGGLPLFPPPCVEGAAVAGVREFSVQQLGQALRGGEGLQSKGRAGVQIPHLPQSFSGEGPQRCEGNIPASNTENININFSGDTLTVRGLQSLSNRNSH